MSSVTSKEFRGLKKPFFDALKEGELRPILDFENGHRDSFLVEIRKNYLDLYFLGHAVKVEQAKFGYKLNSAEVFRPERIKKWPISFEGIKEKYKNYDRREYKSEFDAFMGEIIFNIVRHKNGDISEGVSEMNHYIDNRVVSKKGGVLVIDRQVTYKGARIDLLGLKKSDDGKYAFVIIELKNKENKEIDSVFTQTRKYIDILWDHYDDFHATYAFVLEQKIKLGLIDRKNKCEIISRPMRKKEIEGLVVLDNYNLRSHRLERALGDWSRIHDSYSIKLFLKTNTFNHNFSWDYAEASRKKIWNL